jgi:hypothetical protein
MNAMIAVLPEQGRPEGPVLRKALRRCAFNRNAPEPTGSLRAALDWALAHQPPVTCLEDRDTMAASGQRAGAVRAGPQHLCLRRHHHAGRYREEERDHDD